MSARPAVLVTGGAGFIGSHIVDRLLTEEFEVIVLDDLSNGWVSNLPSRANLEEGSINDTNLVRRLVDKVDGVFHLAAISSVQMSLEDHWVTRAVNFLGSMNVLRAAIDTSQSLKPKLIFASTAAVYGDPLVMPIKESDPKVPMSNYGKDKLEVEYAISKAAYSHSIPSAILRPFNVYGPRQKSNSPYSGVISIFEDRISKHEPLTIFGDGEQVRDFIFVKDVAERFLNSYEAVDYSAPIVNVCSGRGQSILTLADKISTIIGNPVEKRFAPARIGDIKNSVGDPKYCDRILGELQLTSLDLGLKNTFESSH